MGEKHEKKADFADLCIFHKQELTNMDVRIVR